jgi:hypothetical protein
VADQIVLSPTKSSSLRRTRASTSAPWTDNWAQAKGEWHALQGYNSTLTWEFRSLMQFSFALASVKQITSAYLHLFTVTDHAGLKPQAIGGTIANLQAAVKKTAWAEAGGGEAVWTGALPNGGAEWNATYRALAHCDDQNFHESVINVMSLVRYWAPKAVLDNTGHACLGQPNNGLVLSHYGTASYETVFGSAHHGNVAVQPFLVLNVVLKGGPGDVLTSEPNGDIPVGTPQFFVGAYEPGRPDDNMQTVYITKKQSGKADVEYAWQPTADEITNSSFSVPVSLASLALATPYTWVARVKNTKGEMTPYSAPPLTVRWVGTPPVLTAPQPSAVTLDNLISVPFQCQVDVPASHYRATQWRIQLRSQTTPSDPTWESGILWDSGLMTVPLSADEVKPVTAAVTQILSTLYGGPTLDPGNYSWRVLATDQYGATSPWLYSNLTVNAPYVADPGSEVNLTGYGKSPPFRIRIFGMGANRGPGILLAELTDASNVGASEFYNTAGEFFFTLPVNHPQVAVIEPYETHYSLEIHTEEGWRPKAFGLMVDFDANENEVVFYGTDYLGLLSRSVEERFDPTNADLPTDKGGAKYVNATISSIITDQLNKAKAIANSPVGFITVGDIASLPEKITIYASFKQRLPFIAGLIESAKAGTGRKTRLVCERAVNGSFKWRLLYDSGIVRDNILLEYGGMVDGFRAVPYSGWGTSITAVGRTALGTKVYAAVAVATGVDETKMGHWPSNASYADLDDLNDLRRRAAQAANKIGKIGKRMGLSLRVHSLGLKDGWNITDTLPVLIQRGVVDTRRWGGTIDTAHPENSKPGHWTIWGWTWNSAPDGHTSMVLSLLPSESNKASDPNLIPSKPIFSSVQWQVGYGVPTTWSVPPQPTPPPGGLRRIEDIDNAVAPQTALPLSDELVVGVNYQDLNTGCIYELDQDDTSPTYLAYVEVYCPDTTGGGTPYVPDTSPPTAPTIISASSAVDPQDDGTSYVAITAVVGWPTQPTGFTDLAQIVMQSTRIPLADPSQPDWSQASEWTTQVPSTNATGATNVQVVQPSVQANTQYWLRAAARDKSGNLSGWSAVWTGMSAGDDDGPPPPQGIVTVPGNITFAVRWDEIGASDLDYVEVQWRPASAPDWTGAASAHAPGTMVVIAGVTNDVLYHVRLRSVDTSGNVQTGALDGSGNPISGDVSDNTIGWVNAPDVTPTGIPASSVVWTDADIATLFAGNINADWIETGTLRIGNVPVNASGVIVPVAPDTLAPGGDVAVAVYDKANIDYGNGVHGGNLVGLWTAPDPTQNPPAPGGIRITRVPTPGLPKYALRIDDSSLVIQDVSNPANPIPIVTANPLGIDAASITFGSARGGHNMVQNSSFEMGAFIQTIATSSQWDVAADWNAAGSRQGADTNVTTGASALSMTAI